MEHTDDMGSACVAKKWQINNAVKASKTMPSPSRLIMLVLSDCADTDGIIPEDRGPSLRDIVGWTGLSKATVARHLTLLEEEGWVERDRPTIEAARREHARTGYRLHVGHVSERDMPDEDDSDSMSQRETSQSGQDGNGMSHSETRHVSQGDKGMSQSETVPYTDELGTSKTSSTSENATKPKRRSSKQKSTDRPDIERICKHLADRVEANGSLRPTVGEKWRESARLLLDRDGRTVEQVLKAIDWCQDHEFWRSNIKSMSKLRQQYDTLRLQATARTNGRASPGRQLTEVNGLMLGEANIANLERAERIRRLQQAQDAGQQQLSIEG